LAEVEKGKGRRSDGKTEDDDNVSELGTDSAAANEEEMASRLDGSLLNEDDDDDDADDDNDNDDCG
jgi:hypothetical protein